MERLTKRAKRVSGLPGVCCTHFKSGDCLNVAGHCSDGCQWEEAAWARLAAYEDTGLTPEKIMGLCSMDKRAKMAELLRMEENKPLTLEELRGMNGEPVWVVGADDDAIEGNGYAVVEFARSDFPQVWWFGNEVEMMPLTENYGKTWRAYRRRPEGIK